MIEDISEGSRRVFVLLLHVCLAASSDAMIATSCVQAFVNGVHLASPQHRKITHAFYGPSRSETMRPAGLRMRRGELLALIVLRD